MAAVSNSFDSSSFYGTQLRNKKRRYEIKSQIEKRLKIHNKLCLPEDYKPRLGGPSSSWKTFYKLKDAFHFARKTAEDLHVFSYEMNVVGEEKGQRLYLVASYPVFWHYYRQLCNEKRHHYEIIPEGSVCKLYFDLEYMKAFNPDNNGSQMVQILIKYVCYWLMKRYNVTCTRSDVIDLDSSTDSKFSRHLIFQIENSAFKDNIQVGYFVNYILSRLKEILKYSERVTDSGIDVSQDETMELKSNAIKELALQKTTEVELIQDRKEFMHLADETDSQEKATSLDIEDESDLLALFSVEDLRSLLVNDKNGDEVFFVDTGVYTKNRNFRLYLSSKLGKNNPLLLAEDNSFNYKEERLSKMSNEEYMFMASLISNVIYTENVKILSSDEKVSQMVVNKSNAPRNNEDTIEGSNHSPYPEIDKYIKQLVSSNGKNGDIRHWTYFTSVELIIYDIAKFKWCENIGRQHKSNNIMLLVDLKKGVYYQKCHDPNCKGFKSFDHDVPRNILPSFYMEQDDLFDSDVEDEELLQVVDQFETNLYPTNIEDLSDTQLLHLTDELENTNPLISTVKQP